MQGREGPHVKESKADRQLARAQNITNYFMFRRDFVIYRIMEKYDALLYQDLINLSGKKSTKKTDDGFFMCSARFLYRSLRWDDETQTRIIEKLKICGFVEVEYRRGRVRWVKINAQKVEDVLEQAMSKGKNYTGDPYYLTVIKVSGNRGHRSPPLPDKEVNTTYLLNKRRRKDPPIISGFSGNGHSSKIPSFCFKLGDRLRQILRSRKPPIAMINGLKETWANHIRLLWKDLAKNKSRIIDLLDWYENSIHRLDKPTIQSAKQFRQHFNWLEGLKNKASSNSNKLAPEDQW